MEETQNNKQGHKAITSEVYMLTEEDIAHLAQTKYFSVVYETGLIYLSNGYWDCSDSYAAMDYLYEHDIPEKR